MAVTLTGGGLEGGGGRDGRRPGGEEEPKRDVVIIRRGRRGLEAETEAEERFGRGGVAIAGVEFVLRTVG